MNYVPIHTYCKIEREKLKSKSGLIFIPESAEKRNARGYGVLEATGPNADPQVKALIGQRVIFKEFAGSWIELDGERTFVVDHEDILGAIQD